MGDTATKALSDQIAQPCAAYDKMAARWALIDALNGGTQAMRDGGHKWLPQEEKEQTKPYQNRLNRSFLFDGYRDTVRKVVARPFSKPVSINGAEGLTPQLEEIAADADMEGNDLTQLAKELMREALDRGLVHLLVDYPKMREKGQPAPTLADERAVGARPIFIPVTAAQLIGWQVGRAENGHKKLTQIRIKETVTEPAGTYGTADVDQIRVWTESTWAVYRKNAETDEYDLHEEGEHTFKGIPLFTAYFDRTEFMEGRPALEDLAWLNLAHWQSSSDQRNILRFARVGMVFLKGISEKEMEDKGLVMGANQVFYTSSDKADMKVVEHSGNAIGAGRQDLQDLQDRMQLMGMQVFVQRTGTQTATGKAIDEARHLTDIQAWIRTLENMLREAYWGAAQWIGAKLPEDFSIDIYSDFGIGPKEAAHLEHLLKARMAGEIDRETYLSEVRRRGVFSETIEVEEIQARLEAEGPALGELGRVTDDDEGGGE